ncbi:MAG: hypothetical protein Barrevirus27_9, partial [Barrevirus sp.]
MEEIKSPVTVIGQSQKLEEKPIQLSVYQTMVMEQTKAFSELWSSNHKENYIYF